MDPFSITVGAVALLETANKLSKSLMDRYQAFSAAPKKMCEIANDVTMVAGLVEVFSTSVEGAGTGIKFPDKFQRDATNLVDQCFEILREINAVIPPGSRKSDYSIRLRYAFGNEKKIQKHQEKLKQVQHMFMFMTTMWMYQLPSLQGKPSQPLQPRPDEPSRPKDPGLLSSDAGGNFSASSLAMGSWRGVMQQVPVTIGGSGGVNYEATLTLNPIQNTPYLREEESHSHSRSRTSDRKKRMEVKGRKEKNTLENLRRSPYFSMGLFRNPQPAPVTVMSSETNYHAYSRSEEVRRDKIEKPMPIMVDEAVQKKRKEQYKDEYERERARKELEMGKEQQKIKEEEEDRALIGEILSEAEAKVGVEDLISQWFDEVPPTSTSNYERLHGRENPAWSSTGLTPSPSSSGARGVILEHEPPTDGSSSVRRPSLSPSSIPYRRPSQSPSSQSSQRRKSDDWYWRCDNCKKKFQNDERRFECQDCKNFDFCPSCYGSVRHQHPASRFRERGEKERPRSTGAMRYN